MFDKNSSFSPSNKPNNQYQNPPDLADKKINNNEKGHGVEDIFSQSDDKGTGSITEEQKKMAARVLSPDIGSDNVHQVNDNVEGSDKANEQLPRKSNKKMLLITLILFVILFLSGTAFWYYVNYIQEGSSDVDNISENVVLNKNQNNNSNTNINEKSLADIVKEDAERRKNQNINKNILLPTSRLDLDFDGLSDEEENGLGTNIHMADTDSDGLLDKEEVRIYHTDPLIADTDGDGFTDGEEVKNGYNPNGDGKLSSPLL